MNLSEAIKRIRADKGISQSELARRLNLERGNYSRLENRGNKMSLEQAIEIAQALEVSFVDLMLWGEEPVSDNGDLVEKVTKLAIRVKELEELNSVYSELHRSQKAGVKLLINLYVVTAQEMGKNGNNDIGFFGKFIKELAEVEGIYLDEDNQ